MKIQVDRNSKAFAGGGFLAFRQADKLLNGQITRFIDKACPNKGVPTSKHVELLVGQTIHGFKSIRNAWQNAKQNHSLEFVESKLRKQKNRGSYRAIETIGKNNPEETYANISKIGLEKTGFSLSIEHTEHLDTTSSFVTGRKTQRAKKGHSRDHRPGKPQINFIVSHVKNTGFASAYMVVEGNMIDSKMFRKQVKKHGPNTLIVADRGVTTANNKKLVLKQKCGYLFGEKMYDPLKKKAIAALPLMKKMGDGYSSHTVFENEEYVHFFLSKKLREDVRARRLRHAKKTLAGYDEKLARRHRGKTKRYTRITAEGEEEVSETAYRTKRLVRKTREQLVAELSKDDALDGVFVLSSNSIAKAKKALREYKQKDQVEKVFCALKDALNVRPFNARKKESVDGTMFITMLSLLVVSLLALVAGVRKKAVKTLVNELRNVTLVVKKAVDVKARELFCVNLSGLARKLLCGLLEKAT